MLGICLRCGGPFLANRRSTHRIACILVSRLNTLLDLSTDKRALCHLGLAPVGTRADINAVWVDRLADSHGHGAGHY